jgi:Tetratricopeptide repeat
VRKAVATGSVERRPNLPLMYLLVQLGEPSLNAITENVGLAIVERHPRLPPALFFLATFHQQDNRSDRAIELFERIAGIQPPSEHWSTSLALVELGKWYLDRDPRRARAYLERVLDRGSNEDGALDTARGLLKQLRDG